MSKMGQKADWQQQTFRFEYYVRIPNKDKQRTTTAMIKETELTARYFIQNESLNQ
jgi:hypothetical protein